MRRVLSIVAVVLVWACGALASPASGSDMPSVSWNKAIFQTSIDSDACVSVPGKVVSHGVAIGPDQNPVFVADVAGTPATVLLAKYDRETGERLWCTSLQVRAVANKTTFAVPSAQIGGLAIDASGTIFIAGDGGSTPSAAPSSTPGPAAERRRRCVEQRDRHGDGRSHVEIRFPSAPALEFARRRQPHRGWWHLQRGDRHCRDGDESRDGRAGLHGHEPGWRHRSDAVEPQLRICPR